MDGINKDINDSEKIASSAVDITPNKDGGVLKEIKKQGTGEQSPPSGCKVTVHYEGRLTDGTVFDSSKERSPFEFNLGKGSVIKAWDIGVATMKKGEVANLICRSDYAYGASGSPPKIPPNATLIFEVEVIDWEPENLSGKKDKGVIRHPITAGRGFDSPKETANVEIHMVGEYEGRKFDERDVSFTLGEGCESNIPLGIEKALEKFTKGETSKLELKPQYAFGVTGHPDFEIPPNATVFYTVTLKDFEQVEEHWMMSGAKKISEAKIHKEKGTKYFKSEKYALALKMYSRMVTLLDYKSGFEGEEAVEAQSLLLAANLNISMCHLKLQNYLAAKNCCENILLTDKNNVKALFRKGQANLNLSEPQLAKADFEAVLKLEPENKAVPPLIAACNAKLKEIQSKEKKMYANMFEKFAQKDREWRFGWLDGDKPQVEIVPDNPEILEERKRQREAKRRYIENTKRLLEEKREREERERLEKGRHDDTSSDANDNEPEVGTVDKPSDSADNIEKEEEERKKQPDIMKGCFGEWGAEEREREPTDFEKENPDILMLDSSGDFKNM